MELDRYIRIFRKWWWLIVLVGVLAGLVGYVYRANQPPNYEASSMVMIGNVLQTANPDANDFRVGLDLVQTYAELAKTNRILSLTIDALDLPMGTNQLSNLITVTPRGGTSIIVLTVTYSDPVIAAAIANQLAQELVANSPTNLTDAQNQQAQLIESQIAALNDQIRDSEARLTDLNTQLATATGASVITDLQAQRDVLIAQMGDARATLAQFSTALTSLQNHTNSIEVIERAEPSDPLPVNPITTAVVAAVGAVCLALGAIIGFEYIDDRIQDIDEVENKLALSVLTTVRRFRKINQKDASRPGQVQRIPADVEESYRWLSARLARTSLRDTEEETGVFVVTSPWIGDGKSTTIAHLAVQMALMGKRVLLLDADVRQPTLHTLFNLQNSFGLTSLLNLKANSQRTVVNVNANATANGNGYGNGHIHRDPEFANLLKNCVQPTTLRNLRVMTSGPINNYSAKLLEAYFDREWIEVLKEETGVDVILFDTPPCLIVTDTCALAAKTDARVVIVLHAGRARLQAAHRAIELFNQFGVDVEGIVLNKTKARDSAVRYSY